MSGYQMTMHAARRALDMLVTAEEIREALTRPEVTYSQSIRGEGCQVRQAGRIALALCGKRIVSVLYRKAESWSREDLEFALKDARRATR